MNDTRPYTLWLEWPGLSTPAPSMRSKTPVSVLLLAILMLAASRPTMAAHAEDGDCAAGILVEHAFDSGATWSLCAQVAESHGLSIHAVHYRAPGDSLRSVLQQAHLGQLLLHYHDSPQAEAQIDPLSYPLMDDGSSNLLSMSTSTCEGTLLDVAQRPAVICRRIKNNGILAKYAQRPGIQSESLELASAFQRHSLTWTNSFTFTEDGQIRPGISLSGRAFRTQSDTRFAQAIAADTPPLTRTTVLATWRLVFDLDTPGADRVEQFEFPLQNGQSNRRPMSVTRLDTEQWLTVNRENFRGWRIVDSSGAGYYLDPANNGFSYRNADMGWAEADGAITVFNECEQHAWKNGGAVVPPASGSPGCGISLDDFVDEQSLQGLRPVVWYSQSRTLDPRIEDWPVIRDLSIGFDLLPYDWTPASPFETSQ